MILRNKIGGQKKKPKTKMLETKALVDSHGIITKVEHGSKERTDGRDVILVRMQRAPEQKDKSHPCRKRRH